MKTLIIAIGMLTVINLSAQVKKKMLLPFKTVVIEYVYEGSTSGRENVYMDNYGLLQCKMIQTKTKVFGQTSEEAYIEVSKDFYIHKWDPKTRLGSKIKNTLAEDLMNDPDFDPEDFGKRSMESLGFEMIGTETIAGKPCEVWEGLGGSSKIWIWRGLTLKTEMKMLGMKNTSTANVIKVDEGVPSGKFDIPSDVNFQDMGTTDPIELMNKSSEEAGDSADKETEEAPIKNLKDLKGFLKKIKTQ
jgi:hypothetical protein